MTANFDPYFFGPEGPTTSELRAETRAARMLAPDGGPGLMTIEGEMPDQRQLAAAWLDVDRKLSGLADDAGMRGYLLSETDPVAAERHEVHLQHANQAFRRARHSAVVHFLEAVLDRADVDYPAAIDIAVQRIALRGNEFGRGSIDWRMDYPEVAREAALRILKAETERDALAVVSDIIEFANRIAA